MKLNPLKLARNPVMFIVEVGSVVTTYYFFKNLITGDGPAGLHRAGLPVALVHGALRQLRRSAGGRPGPGPGRDPAAHPGGDHRQAARRTTGATSEISAGELRKGDLVLVEAGEIIPGDGEVVEGIASVDESGHHRRVGPGHPGVGRRLQLGHRRHQGALRLDQGAHLRRPRPELPGQDDRPGGRGGAPEDPQRDRPVHPAHRPDHHLPWW